MHQVSSRDPTHMTPSSLSGAGAQLNGRAMAARTLIPSPPPSASFPRGLAFDSLCGNLLKVGSHRNILLDTLASQERGGGWEVRGRGGRWGKEGLGACEEWLWPTVQMLARWDRGVGAVGKNGQGLQAPLGGSERGCAYLTSRQGRRMELLPQQDHPER